MSHNVVEIDCAALAHNFSLVRRQVGEGVRIMAVVKADAYGHGLVEAARVFDRAGAEAFGVATVEEGAALRRAGLSQEVVVLVGILADAVDEVVLQRLSPVILEPSIILPLAMAAAHQGRELGVHLKLDVGMGRAGLPPMESEAVLRRIRDYPSLRLDGLMAHLPSSDRRDSPDTAGILATFREVVADLGTKLPARPCLHLANSGGVFLHPGTHLDMVRPGISLYGGGPGEVRDTGQRQAMRFSTRIVQVRRVGANTGLGYDHTFITQRPSTLAVLPVGYGDNYSRRLSSRAEVLIHGRRVPVIGRVSMNLTLADVTGIEGVAVGDEAVLLGGQGGETISAIEVAGWMESISYEVFCLFGGRTKRVYV